MSRLRASGLIFIFIVVTGFGLSRITLNVDVLALLPQDLPEVQGVQTFYRHFSRPDELVITLEGKGVEVAAKSLALELEKNPELVESVVWSLSFESDPAAAADLLAYVWYNSDPSRVEALKERLAPGPLRDELEELIEDLSDGLFDEASYLRSYDPLNLVGNLPEGVKTPGINPSEANHAFAASDESFRVIYIKVPGEDSMNYQQAGIWLGKIKNIVSAWQSDGGELGEEGAPPDKSSLQIAYTGEPAFVAEIGGAMERDMRWSVTSTIVLICVFFWILHRRLLPLVWLVLMLVVTFGLTISIGSLVIKDLSIMSVGFAAILIGLTIDYGVILYKEARLTPGDPLALKRLVGPSIRWAAITTAAVFFALQLSSFPGVTQLGLLVAIGVLVGSTVMLLFYSPVAARTAVGQMPEDDEPRFSRNEEQKGMSTRVFRVNAVSLFFPLASIGVFLVIGFPGFEQNFKPLQLRNSPSMDAMGKMGDHLGRREAGNQSVVVAAEDLSDLPARMNVAREKLSGAVQSGTIESFTLPDVLIPDLENQKSNRKPLASIAAERERLAAAVEGVGFNEEALGLSDRVLSLWKSWQDSVDGTSVLPEHSGSRWVMDRLFSVDKEGRCAVLGRVSLESDLESITELTKGLAEDGIYITGWNTLDPTVNRLIHRDLTHVLIPVALAMIIMLSIIFRDWRDIILSITTMAFSIGVLLAILSLLHIEWNAFSLSSIPILFGVGLDYSIHMIFALRRNEGDLRLIRQGIFKAILFCGLSTAVGFGSLSLASNLGLASIGLICGLGVLIIMMTTLGLLPYWWRQLRKGVELESVT